MNKRFQIGDFCFGLSCPAEIIPPSNFMIFETSDGVPEKQYTFSVAGQLPTLSAPIIARRADLIVYDTPSGEARLLGMNGRNTFYAYYQEKSPSQTEVTIALPEVSSLHFDTVFTSLFALERQMIQKDCLVLHCAYMKYKGNAILFSAPSETGKTTQANLWERYRGSRTINGDRALLQRRNGSWIACGWPVCGTSEVCNNESTPIQAIVMLSQGKINQATRLSPVQAFAQLYAQITINQWNRSFQQTAMRLLEELITTIPVWSLTCDISEDAVRCLEAALFPTGSVSNRSNEYQ